MWYLKLVKLTEHHIMNSTLQKTDEQKLMWKKLLTVYKPQVGIKPGAVFMYAVRRNTNRRIFHIGVGTING